MAGSSLWVWVRMSMCSCASVYVGALQRLNCVALTSNTCNKHEQTNASCVWMYVSRHVCVCVCVCQPRVDRFNHPNKKQPLRPLITYKATLLFYRRSTWKKALAHTHVHSSGKTYPHTSDVPAPPQTRPPPITHSAPTTFVSSEHTSHQPAAQCHLS